MPEIGYVMSGRREMRLDLRTSYGWKHSESMRNEVRHDCRLLARNLGGSITVLSASGKQLAVIGVDGEELPGAPGVPYVDGER